MSITDERLRQIAKITALIKEKVEWIEKKKTELEEKIASIDGIAPENSDLMSRSASTATERRHKGATMELPESASRDTNITKDLENAIDEAEKDLEELNKEKKALEEFTGKKS